MAKDDRNAEFQGISDKVEAAREKTTAVWQKTRDELAGEVADAKGKASEQWREIHGRRSGDRNNGSDRP